MIFLESSQYYQLQEQEEKLHNPLFNSRRRARGTV